MKFIYNIGENQFFRYNSWQRAGDQSVNIVYATIYK